MFGVCLIAVGLIVVACFSFWIGRITGWVDGVDSQRQKIADARQDTERHLSVRDSLHKQALERLAAEAHATASRRYEDGVAAGKALADSWLASVVRSFEQHVLKGQP